jgi:hypothetical protein
MRFYINEVRCVGSSGSQEQPRLLALLAEHEREKPRVHEKHYERGQQHVREKHYERGKQHVHEKHCDHGALCET